MNINSIIAKHNSFKEKALTNRFFKHSDIMELLKKLPQTFNTSCLGKSVQGKDINLVKWGTGNTKVMLWSQMHGDEATGTMALFDLFNFLQGENETAKLLNENCQLFFIPMVNPDGSELFTRRNAQQIDINRDFLKEITPEAKILKQCRSNINPSFGFNLHDQTTLWSVTGSLKPATLSFLAPAIDQELSIDQTRENAMLVIADIFNDLNQIIPKHIGLFDDEYEPRAFGDNFQKSGMSTILIEAGGYQQDYEKQEIRKYYFGAILSGLISIANLKYKLQNVDSYFSIPKNNKQIFHILIHDVMLAGIKISIGINYEENPLTDGSRTFKSYKIEDIGDLSFCDAYDNYFFESAQITGKVIVKENANFNLLNNEQIILSFQNGKLI